MRLLSVLCHPKSPEWDDLGTPEELLKQQLDWTSTGDKTFGVTLGTAVNRAMSLTATIPTAGFCFTAHSPRIEDYNELFGLGFLKEWIMSGLDWESEAII